MLDNETTRDARARLCTGTYIIIKLIAILECLNLNCKSSYGDMGLEVYYSISQIISCLMHYYSDIEADDNVTYIVH